ncbi:MAG TPA: hypothetical protein VF327_12280 [Gaiellaceae bacterium]
MATATLPAGRVRRIELDSVDDELRHIRDLVFVRDLLSERGSPEDELAVCDAEISRVRRRLAAHARRSAQRLAA